MKDRAWPAFKEVAVIVDPHEIGLTGLIDLHVHTAPDNIPRYGDDLEIARLARDAGLGGVLIKSHWTLTADRATIAGNAVGGVRVFGGLALNATVGGLNPRAVEVALELGAREIWLPTHDAAHAVRLRGERGGIAVLGQDGRPLCELWDIVDLVRDAGAILGTGHLSPEESVAVVRLARERGLGKVLVTHPEAAFIDMPVAVQEELRDQGAFFERCYLSTLPEHAGQAGLERIAAQIRRVGVASTVLSTDLGQAGNPSPPEGLRRYLAGLLEEGFTWQELRRMAADTPADLLGF